MLVIPFGVDRSNDRLARVVYREIPGAPRATDTTIGKLHHPAGVEMGERQDPFGYAASPEFNGLSIR